MLSQNLMRRICHQVVFNNRFHSTTLAKHICTDRSEEILPEKDLSSMLSEKTKEISPTYWTKLIQEAKEVSKYTITKVLQSCTDQNRLDVAESFISFMKTRKEFSSLATKASYFSVLGKFYLSETAENFNDLKSELIATEPISREFGTNVIQGLCSANMMDEAKNYYTKYAQFHGIGASEILKSSILNRGLEEGYKVFKSPENENLNWEDSAIQLLLQKCAEDNNREYAKTVLDYVGDQSHVRAPISEEILSHPFYEASTVMLRSGNKCPVCEASPPYLALPDSNKIKKLKNTIEELILKKEEALGRKTGWKSFKNLIKSIKYDRVIDGKNFLHLHLQKFKQNEIARVLPHNKTLIVCKSNSKFSIQDLCRKRKNIHAFFCHNKSPDDLYALYAALSRFPHCIIVSRDLFRSEKYDVGADQQIFTEWQACKHNRLTDDLELVPVMNSWCLGSRYSSNENRYHFPQSARPEVAYLKEVPHLCVKG